ncbi:MAG TPA: hypothetical protein VIM77_11220 [Mucilaginibacter sp.]
MKKLILSAAIILSSFAIKPAGAQISLSINIGSQPEWGPVGYDRADYYYLPDIDTYYDVNAHQYVYFDNNVWVHTTALPVRYRNYDVYHSYKVVVNENTPWVRNDVYHKKYAAYRGRRDQVIIRDSKEVKYKDHWNGNGRKVIVHKEVRKEMHGNNGRGKGHDKGHGHKD